MYRRQRRTATRRIAATDVSSTKSSPETDCCHGRIVVRDVSPPSTYRRQVRIVTRDVSPPRTYRHQSRIVTVDVSSPKSYGRQRRVTAKDISTPRTYRDRGRTKTKPTQGQDKIETRPNETVTSPPRIVSSPKSYRNEFSPETYRHQNFWA